VTQNGFSGQVNAVADHFLCANTVVSILLLNHHALSKQNIFIKINNWVKLPSLNPSTLPTACAHLSANGLCPSN
jgi:hypothetical protein